MSTDFNLKKKGRYTDPQPNARILTKEEFSDTELPEERNSYQPKDSEFTVDEGKEDQETSQHTASELSTTPCQRFTSRHSTTIPSRQEAKSSTAKKKKLTTTGKRKLTIRKKAVSWTKEEKDALEAGLMSIRGPFWSDIKGMYLEGLRRRTNIDLKDKARNEINAMKRRGKKPKAGTAYYYVNNPELNDTALR